MMMMIMKEMEYKDKIWGGEVGGGRNERRSEKESGRLWISGTCQVYHPLPGKAISILFLLRQFALTAPYLDPPWHKH